MLQHASVCPSTTVMLCQDPIRPDAQKLVRIAYLEALQSGQGKTHTRVLRRGQQPGMNWYRPVVYRSVASAEP